MRLLSQTVYGFRLSSDRVETWHEALGSVDAPSSAAAVRELIESPEIWEIIRARADAYRFVCALREMSERRPGEPAEPTGTSDATPPPLP